MEAKAEAQNKLSSGVFLFKNIINYTVFLVLLSEIFTSFLFSDGSLVAEEFKFFIEILRMFYRVPNNAIDYQCYQD